MTEKDTDSGIDRRTYLTALSAASATGLAGCGGGGGGNGNDGSNGGSSDQELGERVPTLTVASFSGVAGAGSIEQVANQITRLASEHLGVQMNVEVLESTTLWQEAYSDSRSFSFHVDLTPPFSRFLDPSTMLSPFHIKNAGANGRPNVSNYANCEFSQAFEDQRAATDSEARQEAVNRALSASSADIAPITLTTSENLSAVRTDQVNVKQAGSAGPNTRNSEFLWYSEPTNDSNTLILNIVPPNINNDVYMVQDPPTPWTTTVYAPLLYYDRNYELQTHLATDYEVSNSQQTFTFNLREDATFHNGEPITAEDVKWTFEFYNENTGEFPPISEQPFESINVVDEKTVEINMSEPNASFLTAYAPIWGILPKDVWLDAGAEENPANPDFDEIVGSGPYQVKSFSPKQLLALEPYEDHWIDAVGNLTIQGFADSQAALRAFESGSINTLMNITTETEKQIRDAMGDTAEIIPGDGFSSWELRSQHSFAPTMFTEFKHAISQIIDRQLIKQIFGEGEAELYSSFLGSTHPWHPENPDEVLTQIADSPQSNPEKAKQILEDAGWGWDDQGRLHYPPDKDLSPAWPEGSSPCENPDDFECLPELCPE